MECKSESVLAASCLQFSFSRNVNGDFSKKVVGAFINCGGFHSYRRLVSATHLDTLHTAEEAAKAIGRQVEEPLVVMQDEEKLRERKFYKLTPQSAVLTVKLDGKNIEAQTAYGFNTMKGGQQEDQAGREAVEEDEADEDQYFKKEQFNPLWTDLFDR